MMSLAEALILTKQGNCFIDVLQNMSFAARILNSEMFSVYIDKSKHHYVDNSNDDDLHLEDHKNNEFVIGMNEFVPLRKFAKKMLSATAFCGYFTKTEPVTTIEISHDMFKALDPKQQCSKGLRFRKTSL